MRIFIACLLFSLLCAIYALSYGGAFTADDEHLLASAAISLAERGQFEAPQMYGNARIQGDYHDVEPGEVVLGALLVRWADQTQLGRIQALFLVNLIVTALTACLVYATLLSLGYPLITAIAGCLLYGLTTLAWPYATTFYRDPLAAFGLAVGYLGFEYSLRSGQTPTRQCLGVSLGLAGLLLGWLAKSTAAIGFIVIPLVALVRVPRDQWTRRRLWVTLTVAASIVILLGTVSWQISPVGALNRFSWFYLISLPGRWLSLSHSALVEGLLGPLFSPGKSIFLYNPILCLAPFGWWAAARDRRQSLWAPWLVLGGIIGFQAIVFNNLWFGGVNYGPRFLLPTLPLLIISTAPVIQQLLKDRRGRWLLGIMSVWGFLTQLGGVLLNARTYYASLLAVDVAQVPERTIWNIAATASLGHWRQLLAGAAWNPAWVRNWELAPIPIGVVLAGWLIVVTLSLSVGWRAWQGNLTRRAGLASLLVIGVFGILLPPSMLHAYRADPLYSGDNQTYLEAITYLEAHVGPDEAVLLAHYGAPIWYYVLNQARLGARWYSLPPELPDSESMPGYEALRTLAAQLDGSVCRVWLINELSEYPGSEEQEHELLTLQWGKSSEAIFESETTRIKISLFKTSLTCPQAPLSSVP